MNYQNKIVPVDILFNFINSNPALFRNMVVTSGGYDPLHVGHISSIEEASYLGDILVVLVNGDEFLRRKKGQAFLPVEVRSAVVASMGVVDFVVPLTGELDQDTVDEALRALRPQIFAKGGDRCDASNIPEWNTCEELGVKVITGVGAEKKWSSSDYLQTWVDFKLQEANISDYK